MNQHARIETTPIPFIDVAAQLRELVTLVERRVITVEQFDACRRSLLHAD